MFQVDAEREGARRIEIMRAGGELPPATGGGTGANQYKDLAAIPRGDGCTFGDLTLGDLIPKKPNKRASQWAMLALLTRIELDALENQANNAGRLLPPPAAEA